MLNHLLNLQPPSASLAPIAQQLQFTPPTLKPKNECLQYVEVLTIDEKVDNLLDLFQYILSLKSYKNIKIIVFVRGFTSERMHQFDALLESDMKKVRRRYSDFNRFYAYVQCPVNDIESNLKAFARFPNAVLITDVDSRYLGR